MKTVRGKTDHVVVVGAGLAGIATAMRLAAAGRQVTVLERESVPGGRAGIWQSNGHLFDTGPTVLTMPNLIDDVFGRRPVGLRTPGGTERGYRGDRIRLGLISEAGFEYVSAQGWGPGRTMPAPVTAALRVTAKVKGTDSPSQLSRNRNPLYLEMTQPLTTRSHPHVYRIHD